MTNDNAILQEANAAFHRNDASGATRPATVGGSTAVREALKRTS